MLPYPPIEKEETPHTPRWFDIPKEAKIEIVKRVSDIPSGKRFYFLDDPNFPRFDIFLKIDQLDDESTSVYLETGVQMFFPAYEDYFDTGIAFLMED